MAVYDYNLRELTTLLSGLSPTTRNMVTSALTAANMMPTARTLLPIDVMTSADGSAGTDVTNHPISLYLVEGAQGGQTTGPIESTQGGNATFNPASSAVPGAQSISFGVNPQPGGSVIATNDTPVTVVDVGPGGDTLIAGNGATVQALFGANTLDGALGLGTSGTLVGGAGADSIIAGAGNASIMGGRAATSLDTLLAGSGNTTISVAAGHSTIQGAAVGGFSTINIAGGTNVITGVGGTDRVVINPSALASNTADTITGSSQSLTNVFISANTGAATITAGPNGYTDIKFGNGADLEVKNVLVHFSNASGRFSLPQ